MAARLKSRTGKSGCAFEVVLESPETEFVLVTNDGKLITPRTIPRRFKETTKAVPSETDVVKKAMQAEARRASEVNRVRYAAHKHNVKVVKTLLQQQEAHAQKYWQLDRKLRAADRRREDIVAQVRARAQEHCARVEAISRTQDVKTKDLNDAITECLIRAAENRSKTLQDVSNRIAMRNERKMHTRQAQAAGATRAQQQAYWSLDRKMQEAGRRRKANLEAVRERAASPSDKATLIRQSFERDAEVKAGRINDKLDEAAARKQQKMERMKARAQQKSQKVESVNMEQVRKTTDLDISTTTKQLRAAEKRVRKLEEIRQQQKARQLKAERVRMTKRILESQH